jgi:hypothetical protein
MLTGKWTYRSTRNDPGLVGDDAARALALIFGEGVFDFRAEGKTRFGGVLDMGPGYRLSLAGTLEPGSDPVRFAIVGTGVAGTPTAGWRYDYRGALAYSWPEAVGQVPSLVGTVIRVKAHGPNSPAGVTASFIAVRQA